LAAVVFLLLYRGKAPSAKYEHDGRVGEEVTRLSTVVPFGQNTSEGVSQTAKKITPLVAQTPTKPGFNLPPTFLPAESHRALQEPEMVAVVDHDDLLMSAVWDADKIYRLSLWAGENDAYARNKADDAFYRRMMPGIQSLLETGDYFTLMKYGDWLLAHYPEGPLHLLGCYAVIANNIHGRINEMESIDIGLSLIAKHPDHSLAYPIACLLGQGLVNTGQPLRAMELWLSRETIEIEMEYKAVCLYRAILSAHIAERSVEVIKLARRYVNDYPDALNAPSVRAMVKFTTDAIFGNT